MAINNRSGRNIKTCTYCISSVEVSGPKNIHTIIAYGPIAKRDFSIV